MITTYRKLIRAREALAHFYAEKQDYDLCIILAQQAKLIWDAIRQFEHFQRTLLAENSDRDKDGGGELMIRSQANAASYNQAIDEFADREITLPIDPIPVSVLRSVRLSPLDYLALKEVEVLLGIEQ